MFVKTPIISVNFLRTKKQLNESVIVKYLCILQRGKVEAVHVLRIGPLMKRRRRLFQTNNKSLDLKVKLKVKFLSLSFLKTCV